VQRDPPGVPAHHLDDEGPVVGLRGRVQPVDGLHRDVDRGVEAEREVGGVEVVVDGLRYADDVHPVLVQLGGDAEGVLTADGDQCVDAEVLEVRLDLLDAALHLERVGPRRAEDRAAAGQDATHLLNAERRRSALDGSAPPVPEADELVAVDRHPLAHDSADHRVQAGTVATTGQHSDSHGSDPRCPSRVRA
jgi:hypothetical protein